MKHLRVVAPILFVAACGGAPAADDPSGPPMLPNAMQNNCDAQSYAGLVGQDASALEQVLLLGQVRVIRPNQAVTMDFQPNRINFNINADNRIVSVHCG